MATQVIMPQLGESVVEGTITKWLRQEGETIQEMDSLLEVETAKVVTEVPSPASGVILKILVPEGTTVAARTILAWIGQPGEPVPDSGAAASTQTAQGLKPAVPPATFPNAGRQPDLGFISPVVACLARENNIDLYQVKGTGQAGRITKQDVLVYLEKRPQGTTTPEPAPWETPGSGDLFKPTDFLAAPKPFPPTPASIQPQPKTGSTVPPTTPTVVGQGDTLIPLTPIRKAIAEHMIFSKHTAAHVTTVAEADLSKVVAHRQANKPLFARDGANLTYTAYFAAAAVKALKAFPILNSSWSDQGILVHNMVNLGIAVSLGEEGLIVPVIRNAETLSLLGLARSINDLATRARSHRLLPDETVGGTFSITNFGTGRSLFATPVINQPQCAILGIGAIQKRVVVLENDAIAIRPMVYLSLTFDHRIIDGAAADGYLAAVLDALETWN